MIINPSVSLSLSLYVCVALWLSEYVGEKATSPDRVRYHIDIRFRHLLLTRAQSYSPSQREH